MRFTRAKMQEHSSIRAVFCEQIKLHLFDCDRNHFFPVGFQNFECGRGRMADDDVE